MFAVGPVEASARFEAAVASVRRGARGELASLLKEQASVLDECDAKGRSLLIYACAAATGDVAIPPNAGTAEQHECVDDLLAAGADPSCSDNDGWSALHVAAMSGHQRLAHRLLAAGASRAGALGGCDGGTPLSLALFYAKTELADFLAAPAVPDNLRSAAGLGRDLDRFLDGTKLREEARRGLEFYRPLPAFPVWDRQFTRQEILDEALTWAARNNQLTSLERLVSLGADVNSNAYRGTALLWAVYGNHVPAVEWLLDHGADPDLRHDFGGAEHGVDAVAMHLAAQFGALECLELLLARGADPKVVDRAHGGTPRDWAEYSGQQQALALLDRHV